MQNPVRSLFVLHTDPVFRERLRRAADPHFELHFVPDWEAIPELLRDAGHAGILVLDPYHGRGPDEGLAPETRGLLDAFPAATIVAAPDTRDRSGWYDDVRTLGDWGVTDVIDVSAESTHRAVLYRLTRARGRPLRALLEREIGFSLPSRGRAILETAVDVVAEGGHSRDLAEALRLDADTLTRWCHVSGLPVPRRILVWIRLLLAAEMLDDPGQKLMDAAIVCGYSSDTALRRVLIANTGAGPQALREKGAFRTVAAAFLAELTAVRAGATAPEDTSAEADRGRQSKLTRTK